jgi:ribonuclease Z
VFHPADGAEFLERMRTVSIFHDTAAIEPRPVLGPGPVGSVGPVGVVAEALDHRVTTFGYRIEEPDGVALDPDALTRRGLAGPIVGDLLRTGRVDGPTGPVDLEEVSVPRAGQSMAFVMDTAPCEGARALLTGADLAVCESTYLDAHRHLAAQYKHLTAGQAARMATEAGVRRLVLSHFSARYPEPGVFAAEASPHHDDVVEADDLLTVPVPPRA